VIMVIDLDNDFCNTHTKLDERRLTLSVSSSKEANSSTEYLLDFIFNHSESSFFTDHMNVSCELGLEML
jgi:hypothetical protein